MNVVGMALDELYRIFDRLNEDKFDGSLDKPVITIQKAKGGVLGHFTVNKVWQNKNDNEGTDNFYEINVNPTYLDRPVNEIVGTILHEMVHYYNKVNGIKDCSGSRHNKKFKQTAEEVGFNVESDKTHGFAFTKLSDVLESYITESVKPNEEAFKYFRNEGIFKKKDNESDDDDGSGNNKKPKRNYKYICPECGQIVKGKHGIKVKCGECDIVMELEEEN